MRTRTSCPRSRHVALAPTWREGVKHRSHVSISISTSRRVFFLFLAFWSVCVWTCVCAVSPGLEHPEASSGVAAGGNAANFIWPPRPSADFHFLDLKRRSVLFCFVLECVCGRVCVPCHPGSNTRKRLAAWPQGEMLPISFGPLGHPQISIFWTSNAVQFCFVLFWSVCVCVCVCCVTRA